MEYYEKKTLKAQVEHVLKTRPETRNSDAELILILCDIFKHDPIKKATSIKRLRRWFNQRGFYPPTLEEVAHQRRLNIDEWRVAMGYPARDGRFAPPSADNPKTITIPSETRDNVVYYLTDLGNRFVCNCPAYQFKGRCKHVKKATETTRLKLSQPLF